MPQCACLVPHAATWLPASGVARSGHLYRTGGLAGATVIIAILDSQGWRPS
jgi:hypothetical protein